MLGAVVRFSEPQCTCYEGHDKCNIKAKKRINTLWKQTKILLSKQWSNHRDWRAKEREFLCQDALSIPAVGPQCSATRHKVKHVFHLHPTYILVGICNMFTLVFSLLHFFLAHSKQLCSSVSRGGAEPLGAPGGCESAQWLPMGTSTASQGSSSICHSTPCKRNESAISAKHFCPCPFAFLSPLLLSPLLPSSSLWIAFRKFWFCK